MQAREIMLYNRVELLVTTGVITQMFALPKEVDGLLIRLQLPLEIIKIQEIERIVIAQILDGFIIENPRKTTKKTNRTNSKNVKKNKKKVDEFIEEEANNRHKEHIRKHKFIDKQKFSWKLLAL